MSHTYDVLSRAEQHLARREYRAAHGLCMSVLQLDPESARAWFLLGVLTADHDNFARAEELFEKSAALDKSDPRALTQLARCRIALNRHPEALVAAEAAAALSPADPLTLDTLGVVFSRAGLHARAIGFFEQACVLEPANASFQFNLAASRQFSGDFAGAETAYAAALASDPDLHRAWSSRVQLRRQTPDGNFIADLEALFDTGPPEAERALHLGHALAKSYEDLGQPEAALQWLLKAKAPKRAALDYGAPDDAALFKAAARTFRPGTSADGDPSAAPIFVVGLPRTGTTLVDRILSSHPQVASVGESTAFALLAKRQAATPSNLVLDEATLSSADRFDYPALGRDYVAAVEGLAGGAEHFVDKMPLNVLYAGLIHRALPNARIVCLRRDPMDACLANFRQLFATAFTYYNYAYDLADTGRYYLGFDRLVAHWRAVLPPDRFTEIAYEDLVADQEGQTRQVLAFCDLPWDDRCLSFHENAAPVATASAVQVRQPLYATSIGRWRKYGEGLEPLRRVLEEGGIKVG